MRYSIGHYINSEFGNRNSELILNKVNSDFGNRNSELILNKLIRNSEIGIRKSEFGIDIK